MACQIVIVGHVAIRPESGDVVETLMVYGVAFDCENVEASVEIGGTSYDKSVAVDDVGFWSAEINIEGAAVECGDVISRSIVARCSADQSCSDSMLVEGVDCQDIGPCPDIGAVKVDVFQDDASCNADLERHVELKSTLIAHASGNVVTPIQFSVTNVDTGIVDYTAAVAAEPGVELVFDMDLPEGRYYYEMHLITGSVCIGALGVFHVPACHGCANIAQELFSISETCIGGRYRLLKARFQVSPASPSEVNAVLRVRSDNDEEIVAVLDSKTNQTDPFTLLGEASLEPGDYGLEVAILMPEGCAGWTGGFTVAACKDAGDITVDEDGGTTPENDGNTTPQDDRNTTPQDDGDTTPQNDGGTTAGSSGGIPPVIVGSAIDFCAIFLYFAIFVLVMGVILYGVGTCLIIPAAPVAIVPGIVAAIGMTLLQLGSMLVLAFTFTCGSCRRNCELLNFLLVVLIYLTGVNLLLGLLGTIFDLFSPSAIESIRDRIEDAESEGEIIDVFIGALQVSFACVIAFINTIYTLLSLIAVVTLWRYIAGCVPWPEFVPERARLRLPDWMTFLCGR